MSHYIIMFLLHYSIIIIFISFMMEGYFALMELIPSMFWYSSYILFPIPFFIGMSQNEINWTNIKILDMLLFLIIPIPYFFLFHCWPLYPLIIFYFYCGYSITCCGKEILKLREQRWYIIINGWVEGWIKGWIKKWW